MRGAGRCSGRPFSCAEIVTGWSPLTSDVVITGMGAVTPMGIGVDTMWKNLLAGKSGVRLIEFFDPSEYSCKIAGQASDFDPLQFMSEKQESRTDRFVQLALAAAKLALDDSGLEIGDQ